MHVKGEVFYFFENFVNFSVYDEKQVVPSFSQTRIFHLLMLLGNRKIEVVRLFFQNF